MDEDFALALQLQSELFDDKNVSENAKNVSKTGMDPVSLVDPYWELTDPNPDIRSLFLQFNERFFWSRLSGIEVRWSPRMTLCAGLCYYERRGGLCSVRLSVPLLQLRPRKDLIETLLHEMIHAYLFVTDNNKDHDGHGPEFHKHMYRINKEAGTSISVYHNFHDEVDACRQHWWRCDGPCRSRKPYFGYVKRSMNRAPSKNDTWWNEHQRTCGGTYTKVKEPEGFGQKKSKSKKTEEQNKEEKVPPKSSVKSMDIRIFGGMGKTTGASNKPSINIKPPTKSTPTATVTSSSQVKTNKPPGKIGSGSPVLSGMSTPGRASSIKNKPVSQGGTATMGKKPVLIFDFSDSDDSDDELLGSMPLDNGVFEETPGSSKEPDFTEGAANDLNDCDELDLLNTVNGTREKVTDISVNSSGSTRINQSGCDTDLDSNDVRAMLRKVWGEKQFGSQKHAKSSMKTNSVGLLDERNVGVKRLSDETSNTYDMDSTIASPPHIKRPRIVSGYNDSSFSDLKGNTQAASGTNSAPKSLQTSPIGKMFSKITSKQNSETNPVKPKQTSETGANIGSRETTPVVNSTEVSSCPICSKEVPMATINDHLDLCLTLQAIS